MTQTTAQFVLTEEQTQLADSANRYASARLPYDRWLARARAGDVFDAPMWREMADFGWLALGIPEAYGGLGFTLREHACLMESLGPHLLLEPYWSTAILGAKLIEYAAATDQQQRLLSAVGSGDCRLAFACFEPESNYDITLTRCQATRADGGYVLNGRKIVVLDCQPATDVLVLARTSGAPADAHGLSLFRVDPGQTGIAQSAYPSVDSRQCSDLSFTDVVLAQTDLLGSDGQAHAAVERAIDYANVALCSEAIGLMSHLIAATIQYLKTREQFGHALADFQVLRHRIVDMYVACEQTRSLTMMAAACDAAPDSARARAVAAAKAQVGTAGRFVGESAVQLHGAIGMTDDLPIGHYMKRLMAIDALFGNADFQLRRFAGLTRMGL